MRDIRQGIVHVIGPEQGFTLPGTTIVCGDSHTSTHGAFGALAFGIGTSEVEHVLATQTLVQKRPKTMRISVDGELPVGCTAKDVILAIIGKIGTAGGTGHVIEYAGSVIRGLSMEGRMTDLQHVDRGRRPRRADRARRDDLRLLQGPADGAQGCAPGSRPCAGGAPCPPTRVRVYDTEVALDAAADRAAGHLGHLAPGRGADHRHGARPQGGRPARTAAAPWSARSSIWASSPARRWSEVKVDTVFIGSCTNGRIEDLRVVAKLVEGKQVAPTVRAMIVPGSGLVKHQAEAEGLDEIFKAAGFDWREAGCSMCLGMNPDQLKPGERCASHQQPQLRGPPGQGRPHASASARPWRRRRR